jgi:hypothetical protein
MPLQVPDRGLLASTMVFVDRILQGEVGLVEGCRSLVQLAHCLGLHEDSHFLVAIAIDSETDQYPLGDERKIWHTASLERKDRELAAYEDLIREDSLVALRDLRAYLESLTCAASGVQ